MRSTCVISIRRQQYRCSPSASSASLQAATGTYVKPHQCAEHCSMDGK